MNSREKGKRGERELAKELQAYGYDTKRGQQYCGADGNADVVGLPGIWIECKRAEQLRMKDWIEQARNDARAQSMKDRRYIIPTVMHRRNNEEWLVTMRLDDWQIIYDKYYEFFTGQKGVSR